MKKTRKDLIEKIRALLDLSKGKANQAEAELAASRVAEMLEKYKLTLDEVEQESEEFERETLDFSHTMDPWEILLVQAICWNCFCRAANAGPTRAMIVGKRNEIEVVKYLIDYLHRSIRALAAEREWADDILAGMPDVKQRHAKFMAGFKMGASANVAKRLRAERLARERARHAHGEVNENAVIRREDAALDQHMKDKYGEAKTPVEQNELVGSLEGQVAGFYAAEGIALTRAMGQGAGVRAPRALQDGE